MLLKSFELRRPYQIEPPFGGDEYVAWVISEDSSITLSEMERLSHQLVNSGCRFAVCSGINCSAWDDAVDFASIERDLSDSTDLLVMTSWHEEELYETAKFFVGNTFFEGFVASKFAIFSVGGNSGKVASELSKVLMEGQI